jgi:hypothetical protein
MKIPGNPYPSATSIDPNPIIYIYFYKSTLSNFYPGTKFMQKYSCIGIV